MGRDAFSAARWPAYSTRPRALSRARGHGPGTWSGSSYGRPGLHTLAGQGGCSIIKVVIRPGRAGNGRDGRYSCRVRETSR